MFSTCICVYHIFQRPAAAAAAAKSLQSCLILCNPIDCSPPGSTTPGILQARTLEWFAISFSSAWKWKVKVNRSMVSDSSQPHGLQPTRLLHPWDCPGKSTGVGCHCLLLNGMLVFYYLYVLYYCLSTCQCKRNRSHPWVRKIPWRKNGNPFQYSCLGKPMDRGALQATVLGITKESDTTSWLNNSNVHTLHFHLCLKISLG